MHMHMVCIKCKVYHIAENDNIYMQSINLCLGLNSRALPALKDSLVTAIFTTCLLVRLRSTWRAVVILMKKDQILAQVSQYQKVPQCQKLSQHQKVCKCQKVSQCWKVSQGQTVFQFQELSACLRVFFLLTMN